MRGAGTETTNSVHMLAPVPLYGDEADAGDVDIPAIQVVTLGHRGDDAAINGICIDDLDLGKPDPFLKPRRRRNPRHHHQLHQLLRLGGQFPPLGLLQPVLRR